MNSREPVDAVILDLTVPGGMGGQEAIKKIAAVNPSVKAIVSSGYSSDPVMSDCDIYCFSAVLKKPYNFHKLNASLNNFISGKFLS